jgi:hypothetical protein
LRQLSSLVGGALAAAGGLVLFPPHALVRAAATRLPDALFYVETVSDLLTARNWRPAQ